MSSHYAQSASTAGTHRNVILYFPDLSPQLVTTQNVYLEGAFRFSPTLVVTPDNVTPGVDISFAITDSAGNGSPDESWAYTKKWQFQGPDWGFTTTDTRPTNEIAHFRRQIGSGDGINPPDVHFTASLYLDSGLAAGNGQSGQSEANANEVAWLAPRVVDSQENDIPFGRVWTEEHVDISGGSGNAPAASPVIQTTGATPEQLQFTFPTETGRTYVLQRTTNFLNWESVLDYFAEGNSTTISPPVGTGDTSFFRLQIQ